MQSHRAIFTSHNNRAMNCAPTKFGLFSYNHIASQCGYSPILLAKPERKGLAMM
jgi:hypothetical protein